VRRPSVGKYTSPHLVDFRERFLVDGRRVDEDYVVDFIERWTPTVETYRCDVLRGDDRDGVRSVRAEGVDVAVIETGSADGSIRRM
jgi:dihydrofolate synthase/folylpolyglutamate synthase